MPDWIYNFLRGSGLDGAVSTYISGAVVIVLIFLAAALAYYTVKFLLLKILKPIFLRSKINWDDTLFKHRVIERLTLVVPAFVVYAAAPLSPSGREWLQRAALCLIAFGFMLAFDRFLNAADEMYLKSEVSKSRPIKGYLQVLKIAAYAIGMIIIVSVLIDRSPLLLLGGIGAATAVLLLVFQNTILGFVAGVQLTENDMVRLEDWIEMPNRGADGVVTEISLHTVKVQNWDNTITTIPTHTMVTESFKNYRNMQEAGGRRIKRAVSIDMTSVRFCDDEMLERYKKIQYIKEYLMNKTSEIDLYNQAHNTDLSSIVNGRRLTNIGTFRAYIDAYLKNNPRVHKGMARLVRQLTPTEHGLPVEIYVFTDTTE